MNLILQCNTGGLQIVKLLLECISNENWTLASSVVESIKEKCRKFLCMYLLRFYSFLISFIIFFFSFIILFYIY